MRDRSAALVRKLWQYCAVLRDDGLSYPDYVEQLTYLLFLKMSDEQGSGTVPSELGWASIKNLDSQPMYEQYGRILAALGDRGGMLGMIFGNARNKIKDPAKLRFLVRDLIGQTEWTGLSDDVKGEAYEGLLEKNARDTKSGAGQYFTPRPLIDALVECIDPRPGEIVCDPACGTGGFLLSAFQHMNNAESTDGNATRLLPSARSVWGVELVEEVARLATMNLLLHGISGSSEDALPITCADSLKLPPSEQVDVVLTNPPFGVKGTVTYGAGERKVLRGADELTVVRPDFWVQTANKQLNFLQHIYALMRPGGRAAVIVPDNVLFESGAAVSVRRRLMQTCDLHTLLRLPTGLFYAQGVKANVLFFDRLSGTENARAPKRLWVYDLRSDNRFTLKTRPLQRDDLDEFVGLYCRDDRPERLNNGEGRSAATRWRSYDLVRILESENCSLDLLPDDDRPGNQQTGLARLSEISKLITDDLTRALEHISNATTRN